MRGNAGERLFEAIGQIPDQMVQEAAQSDSAPQEQELDLARIQDTDQPPEDSQESSAKAGGSSRRRRRQTAAAKLERYFKYLPVAACLCMVLSGAGYVVYHFMDTGQERGIQMSGSLYSDTDGAGEVMEEGVVTMDQADVKEDADTAERSQQSAYGTEDRALDTGMSESQSQITGNAPMLPVRYDAYEGPVFPLTATGDTQKLKVSRSLNISVHTQEQEEGIQPLIQVTDHYRLKNTSRQDKTLQLVYPFVTTLNRAYAMEGSILEVKGQEQAAVTYGIGESILAYRAAYASESASIEDYRQIFTEKTDYQEQALAKEADWDRSVRVYTFSDIQVQEGAAAANASGVIGVTVNGAQADVLTYGFDHSFTREDGGRNYCFFLPKEERKRLLIVTGEMEGEPELGYYANLDCVDKIAGVACSMEWEEMPYGDALRLCSKDAARKLQHDYDQGLYDAQLPEYLNADAAFRVLTMIGEEEDFYRVLTQRYENTELTEVFERMFGETRVVYAMATVTIPAKETIQAVVQTQKRQNAGNYLLLKENRGVEEPWTQDSGMETDAAKQDAGESDGGEAYAYEFLAAAHSRLPMKKTKLQLTLPAEWKIAAQTCGLKEKQEGLWKGKLLEADGNIVITGAFHGKS